MGGGERRDERGVGIREKGKGGEREVGSGGEGGRVPHLPGRAYLWGATGRWGVKGGVIAHQENNY